MDIYKIFVASTSYFPPRGIDIFDVAYLPLMSGTVFRSCQRLYLEHEVKHGVWLHITSPRISCSSDFLFVCLFTTRRVVCFTKYFCSCGASSECLSRSDILFLFEFCASREALRAPHHILVYSPRLSLTVHIVIPKNHFIKPIADTNISVADSPNWLCRWHIPVYM